jgi:cellulose synthase/poly-beta-1,6-N-acetylglucosamine synthase-like glycosyltransferase
MESLENGGFQPAGFRGWPVLVAGSGLLLAGLVGFSQTVAALAYLLQGVFLIYFVRHLGFAIGAMAACPRDRELAGPAESEYRPRVSVVVACHNEESVVQQLVESLLRLDYPAELLQIVIVDDGSTDRTAQLLAELSRLSPAITPIHRPTGAGGGKPGALNYARHILDGEIEVVFDADHRPRPDVIRRLVRHFESPVVGAVQGRCRISNGDDTLLARLVELDYLAGYLVNEYGRQSMFCLPASGGANCAVRLSVLDAVGGWNAGSVTEDTDLTLRLLLSGWRTRYDVTAVDEEEGVVSFRRFWHQRYRWARGHQQAFRDYRGHVWRSTRLSLMEKVESTLFLYSFHLPVLSAGGLVLIALWALGLAHIPAPADLFVFWTLLFVGSLLEMGAGLVISRASRSNVWALFYFLPVLLVAMAVAGKAFIDQMLRRPYRWVKTARAGDCQLAGSTR